MTDPPLISVVVCTYNRADLLADALDDLCAQTLDPALYEVIVVDNSSTDNTREVVGAFAQHENVRYVLETRQGLGYARNRGWQEASGQYVGYTDDDVRVPAELVQQALELLEDPELDAMCVGGRILPYYTSTQPDWFDDAYESRSWGAGTRWLRPGENFSGSNMFWRRELLAAYGGFSTDRGVSGDYLAVGEETALFDRIWQSAEHPRFYYSPDLVVYHWVDPRKMTVSYRIKRALITGQDVARHRRDGGEFRFWARHLYRALRYSIGALPRVFRHRHWQRWVYEDWNPFFVSAGVLLTGLGINIRVRQRDS